MPYLFAFLAAVSFSFCDLFLHLGMKSRSVTSAHALLILLLASNILLLVAAGIVYFITGFPPLNWLGMLYFILAGLMSALFGQIFTVFSIKHIGATRTATLRINEVFLTMLMALAILGEVITLYSMLGGVVLVTGIVMIINETNRVTSIGQQDGDLRTKKLVDMEDGTRIQLNSKEEQQEEAEANWYHYARLIYDIIKRNINAGAISALTAAFFFALGSIFRQFALEYIPSAIMGALVGTFIALLAVISVNYSSGQLHNPWRVTKLEVIYLSLGGAGSAMGTLLMFLALDKGGAVSMIAALKNTSPLFTFFLCWLLLRKVERFTIKLVVSILLSVIGATVIVFSY